MKRKTLWWMIVCAALMLGPGHSCAGANIFSDMTSVLGDRMDAWIAQAIAANAQDLNVVLTVDRKALAQGETAQVHVTLENPRLHECGVAFALSLSHEERFDVTGGAMQREVLLPAAHVTPEGAIEPGCMRLDYAVTMASSEKTDGGVTDVTVAATLREGTRWYQQSVPLRLCTPKISGVLKASQSVLALEDTFYYEVTLVNSGGAAGQTDVTVTLPEGVCYAPQAVAVTEGEAKQAAAQEAVYGVPQVDGQTLSYVATVPAARYDARGELIAPSQTALRIPVRVEASALEETPTARRTLVCSATLEGSALQNERVTVQGPIIACTLMPSVRDVQMGDMVSYTCEVVNTGYTPADVCVTVQVPEGMRFARFVTRGQQNRAAGDTLSWVVHLDAAEFDLAGEAKPVREEITYTVRTQELKNGVRSLLVPATAVYQIGGSPAQATKVALTTVHRPSVMGFTGEEWFLLFWAGVVLILTVIVLIVLIRRDTDKAR